MLKDPIEEPEGSRRCIITLVLHFDYPMTTSKVPSSYISPVRSASIHKEDRNSLFPAAWSALIYTPLFQLIVQVTLNSHDLNPAQQLNASCIPSVQKTRVNSMTSSATTRLHLYPTRAQTSCLDSIKSLLTASVDDSSSLSTSERPHSFSSLWQNHPLQR